MLLNRRSDRPILADVFPNCLAAMRGDAGEFGLPAVRGCVVVVVDGLGAQQLLARSGHARTLMRAWGDRQQLMSFPSTTVAGITSITTGQLAGGHGMVAYSVWDREYELVRNQIAGWDHAGMLPTVWQLAPTLFEGAGVDAAVVSVAEYRQSGLSHASLRGAEYFAGESMLERSKLAASIAAQRKRPLVYCYHAELDQVGHKHGWESDAWLAQLEALDAAMSELVARIPSDVGVLVVADHGMVDTPRDTQIDIPEQALRGVVAVAGEPRLRHLYLDVDAQTASETAARRMQLAQDVRNALDGRALVVTQDQAIEWGWYGSKVAWQARERIGDVLIAATENEAYYTEAMPESARQMRGQHGSVTDAETLVPCIRFGAFGDTK